MQKEARHPQGNTIVPLYEAHSRVHLLHHPRSLPDCLREAYRDAQIDMPLCILGCHPRIRQIPQSGVRLACSAYLH